MKVFPHQVTSAESVLPPSTRGRGGAWFVFAWLGLFACLSSLSVPALAQTTQGERAFVYGINAAIPGTFTGTFAPPAAGTIYLLAGETSVISPRYTEIYFWPITNEYRANWNTLNEPVPGTLEVVANGNVVAELAPTDYTIHFTPDTAGTGTSRAEIFLGEDAVAAEERFRARQEAFQEASSAYAEAERAWMAAVADANTRRQAGEEVTVPPAPERPAPIGIFSNGLNHGIPIDLAPGRYTIRLRGEDGAIVPGSERELVIFSARRTGTGYTVVPETRWTTPDESPAPGDVILGAAESTLYLEPHQAREYPARAWVLLQNPQQPAGDAGGWAWVNGERLDSGALEIAADETVAQQPLTPYRVKQLPGSQLGYEVLPADAPEAQLPPGAAPRNPDFAAYPLALGASGEQARIEMLSEQGESLPGSQRLVRVPENPPLSRLFLLPVIPLVIGGIVLSRRRRPVRLPREIAG